MNLANAIPQDDLQLARLSAAKLAEVMQGIMSVGMASLELESPADFLTGKDQILLGFLEVLRCIGVRPGYADQVDLLRQPINQLADLVRQFQSLFMTLAHWRTLSPKEAQETASRLAGCYTEFFRALGDFTGLLGVNEDYSVRARRGTNRVEEFLRVLNSAA